MSSTKIPALAADPAKARRKLAKALQVQGKALQLDFPIEDCFAALDAANLDIEKAAELVIAKCLQTCRPSIHAGPAVGLSSSAASIPITPEVTKVDVRAVDGFSAETIGTVAAESAEILSSHAVNCEEMAKSLEDRLKDANAALLAIGRLEEVEHVMTWSSSALSTYLHAVKELNATLFQCLPSPDEPGLPERAVLKHHLLVSKLPFELVSGLFNDFAKYLRLCGGLRGFLSSPTGVIIVNQKACFLPPAIGLQSILAAVETCLAMLAMMAAPDLDRRLHSDTAVDAAVLFLKTTVTTLVIPVYNVLDTYWREDRELVQSASQTTPEPEAEAAAEEWSEDDCADETETVADMGAYGKSTTLRQMQSAYRRIGPLLRPLGDLLHSVRLLSQSRILRDTHIDVCAKIAIQISMNCIRGVKASRGGASSNGPEESLRFAAELLLQVMFSVFEERRFGILREVAANFVIFGSIKKQDKLITISSSILRPYGSGPTAMGDSRVGLSADLDASFSSQVQACTVVVCNLLQMAAGKADAASEKVVSRSTTKKGKSAPSVSEAPLSTSSHSQLPQLAVFYVRQIVSWVSERLAGGTGTTALPVQVSLASGDDAEPRLVVRRLCIDLLNMYDLVEWPASTLLLTAMVGCLIDLVKPPTLTTIQATPDKNVRGLSTLSVSLLGLTVARLTLTRLHSQRQRQTDFTEIQQVTVAADSLAAPASAAEEMQAACQLCSADNDVDDILIACDSCSLWYHAGCVGILQLQAQKLRTWMCDKCVMQSQLNRLQGRVDDLVARLSVKGEVRNMLSENKVTRAKRQLMVNHLTDLAYNDYSARIGRSFWLSKWAAERSEADDGLGREYYASQIPLPHRSAVSSGSSALSPQGTANLFVELLMSEPVLKKYDSLLGLLLSSFESDASRTRATLIKSISEIIRVAPESMAIPQIRHVVESHLKDSSRMVRCEALDLVGKYVCLSQSLVDAYFDILLHKIEDEGVSVRKKAVGIFKDLLSRNMLRSTKAGVADSAAPAELREAVTLISPQSQLMRAWNALLHRASDESEEDAIRELVESTLSKMWLGMPSTDVWKGANLSEEESVALAALKKQVHMLGSIVNQYNSNASAAGKTEVMRIHASNKRLGSSATASDRTMMLQAKVKSELRIRRDVLVAMADHAVSTGEGSVWLERLLRRLMELGNCDVSVARLEIAGVGPWNPANVCCSVASLIIQDLVALSYRREGLMDASTSAASDTSCAYEDCQKLYEQELVAMFASLETLSRLSVDFVAKHMECIISYLKTDAVCLSTVGQKHVLCSVCNITREALLRASALPSRIAQEVRNDLAELLVSSSYWDVMEAAASALVHFAGDDTALHFNASGISQTCCDALESLRLAAKRRLVNDAGWMTAFAQPSLYESVPGLKVSASHVPRYMLVLGLLHRFFLGHRLVRASSHSGDKRPRTTLAPPSDDNPANTTVATPAKRMRLLDSSPGARSTSSSTTAQSPLEASPAAAGKMSSLAIIISFTGGAITQANTAASMAIKSLMSPTKRRDQNGQIVARPILQAIRTFENIATYGVLSLAQMCRVEPRVPLESGYRGILKDALTHKLPLVKEAGLRAILELIAAQEIPPVHHLADSISDIRNGAYLEDGDASIITGAVQELFPLIVQLMADSTADIDDSGIYGDSMAFIPPFHHRPGGIRIRLLALKVMDDIVRHGIVDPDSCTSPIIAATTDADRSIANKATSIFTNLVTRYPARVESRLMQGVIDSYNYQKRVFHTVAARHEDSDGHIVSVLHNFYVIGVKASGRVRMQFLRQLVQRVLPESWSSTIHSEVETDVKSAVVDVHLARYLVQTLMFLPYTFEDELLVVLSGINRLIAMHGENVLVGLSHLQDETTAASAVISIDTAHQMVRLAWIMVFLLAAKRFLKTCYDMKDARILAFDSTASASKLQEKAVFCDSTAALSDVAIMPAPADSASCGEDASMPPVEDVRQVATLLANLLADPLLTADMGKVHLIQSAAFKKNMSRIGVLATKKAAAAAKKTGAKPAAPKGRRKTAGRKAKPESDSEDSAVEDYDDVDPADNVSEHSEGDAEAPDSGAEDIDECPVTPLRRSNR